MGSGRQTGHRRIDTESPLPQVITGADLTGQRAHHQVPRRTEDPDEAKIFALLIARDPAGIELAYDRWAAILYPVAFKITQREDRAERSLFDAYLEVWRHPDLAVNRRGSLLRYLGDLVVTAAHSVTLEI